MYIPAPVYAAKRWGSHKTLLALQRYGTSATAEVNANTLMASVHGGRCLFKQIMAGQQRRDQPPHGI
jgi:hypothetical protein